MTDILQQEIRLFNTLWDKKLHEGWEWKNKSNNSHKYKHPKTEIKDFLTQSNKRVMEEEIRDGIKWCELRLKMPSVGKLSVIDYMEHLQERLEDLKNQK